MRRTVHISGQIEPFFGTLDENVRLLEDSLQVRTHLNDTRLTIEGLQDGVDQAVKIVEEYNHVTRHGRKLTSAEVKSLIHVATEVPGESLRGTLQEKVDPYMRPLYDALYDMLEPDKLDRFLEKGIIEVAPLAFMRGRTLNDSFVILDEAQNTTSEQMKMFLTRLGFNSKAV